MSDGAAGGRPQSLFETALVRLRPHPHRGDVIAAGAVPLALFAIIVPIRMMQWPLGARFAVVFLIAALLLTMGWLAELEADGPRAYHSALLLAGLLPMVVALLLLARLLGAQPSPGPGAFAWTLGLEAGLAAVAAHRANSAACTLLAALALAGAAEAFVQWAFNPHGPATFRAVLLVLTLVFVAGTLRLRERRRRHAVQLVNAAAALTVVLAASFLVVSLIESALQGGSSVNSGDPTLGGAGGAAGFGWKLWILGVGLAVIAYAGADHEPGPAYFGVVLLIEFGLLVGLPPGSHGSLVGWPLFLFLVGAAGLAIGMRPRRPLPPQPAGQSAAPTVPLKREDH